MLHPFTNLEPFLTKKRRKDEGGVCLVKCLWSIQNVWSIRLTLSIAVFSVAAIQSKKFFWNGVLACAILPGFDWAWSRAFSQIIKTGLFSTPNFDILREFSKVPWQSKCSKRSHLCANVVPHRHAGTLDARLVPHNCFEHSGSFAVWAHDLLPKPIAKIANTCSRTVLIKRQQGAFSRHASKHQSG